jgi:cathepsin X
MANNITDETCAIYEAKGRGEGKICDAMAICKDCSPSKGCWARENAKIYGIHGYAEISGEDAMKQEILNRGPYLGFKNNV